MKKIIEFLKEDWIFKVIMVVVAVSLGISQYFNYESDNAIIPELILVTISSITVIGSISMIYYIFIKKKMIDVVTFSVGVALSVAIDMLSHLIF